MVSTVTEEGLWHEGGQKRNVSVGLTHLHLPQLHLNSLKHTQTLEVLFSSKVKIRSFDLKPVNT